METIKYALVGIGAGLLLAASAACNGKSEPTQTNPYLQPDETWISLSGKAVDTRPDGFVLDYGEGVVTVEMDDWDWYDESAKVLEGDEVTVYGRVDDDTFETTSIEASSVYVESLGTYFFASAADEEDLDDHVHHYWLHVHPVAVGDLVVRGRVTSVDGREFTIDDGVRQLTVDTIGMSYNPLDDIGYQRIDVGDYVSVRGNIDVDAWEEAELMADSVTTLHDD